MPQQKKVSQEANGAAKPRTKLAAVREILRQNAEARGSEIAGIVKSQYGMKITPKQAGKYRYMILQEMRGGGGRRVNKKAAVSAVVAGGRGSAGSDQSGYDDLLRAAQKLGWRRVKIVVDQVVQAPS
jgi:hypothetical protein